MPPKTRSNLSLGMVKMLKRNKKKEIRKKKRKYLPSARNSEQGNVFMFILIGIVLFAALGMTVSRGFQSSTTSNLSKREAELAASEILTYAQSIERAINRLRRNNVSESDISFDHPDLTGYDHAQPNTNKVFETDGGRASYNPAPTGSASSTEWLFTGASCITNLETGASGCDSDTNTRNEELLIALSNVDAVVCSEINDALQISTTPTDSSGGLSSTKFQGSFADDTEITLPGGPFITACFTDGSNNHFYHTLIAR